MATTLPTIIDIENQKNTPVGNTPPTIHGASRGFRALDKLTKPELLALTNTLGAQYKRNTNRSSAQCMFASHALPVTHLEAQYIALKMFDAIGLPRSEFSTGAIWHSNPIGKARTLGGSKKGYTSDASQQRGLYTLRCATHAMRANRALCLRECLQVIVTDGAKSLYTVATKKAFALTVAKRTKRTTKPVAQPKPEAQPETQPKPENVA